MRERPILFSALMVRAILDGRKTITRRVVHPPRSCTTGVGALARDERYADVVRWLPETEAGVYAARPGWWTGVVDDSPGHLACTYALRCPYGEPGDRLWVRETHALDVPGCEDQGGVSYRADHQDPRGDGPAHPMHWHPSIHMPRWASRLLLDVVSVRPERLHAIAASDVEREGVSFEPGTAYGTMRHDFAVLWDRINGDRLGCAWRDDPWVWRVEFRRAEV